MGKITCRWKFFQFWKSFIKMFISLFSKRIRSTIRATYLLEELPVTCHYLLKILTFLIKLTASLPVSVLFRCNLPQFRPVTLIFELSTMSNCSADRCSFTLFTVSVAFPLPVLLTKFDIHTFDLSNVFSIKLLSVNILSKIALNMLFGASLVPTCKMTLSGAFLTKVKCSHTYRLSLPLGKIVHCSPFNW